MLRIPAAKVSSIITLLLIVRVSYNKVDLVEPAKVEKKEEIEKQVLLVLMVEMLGKGSKKTKWKFKRHLPNRHRAPQWHKFLEILFPTIFLLQLNHTYMKRILHFKNITFKSSYNWFKIDIHQQVRLLTANYLAMFKVISTTIYT